jgi:hypothetical protein
VVELTDAVFDQHRQSCGRLMTSAVCRARRRLLE